MLSPTSSALSPISKKLVTLVNNVPQPWLNLQARYDLEVEKDKFKGRIESEVKVFELQSV